MNVFGAIQALLKHQNSFAAFRLPGQSDPQLFYDGVFVKQKIEDQSPKDAFILAPFIESDSCPELAYVAYKSFDPKKIFSVPNPKSGFQPKIKSPHILEKEVYLKKTEQLIERMQQSELDKIVFSRVMSKDIPLNYNWSAHYARLCEKYPEAFVYFIALDKNHFWLGATPETLVNFVDGVGETMALAGTQSIQNKGVTELEWKQKEIDEQAYVRNNILETLRHFRMKWLHQGELKTKTAGQVAHLVNHFWFALSEEKSPLNLARVLHPTPAVCGQPKHKASLLITETESHDRSYYTGFLGTIDSKGNTQLFVNLRCMQVLTHHAYIYVGGGLTADSDPHKEWEETELKAQTMLAVFSK
ncbi:MAG: isochorismate synthase [Bacteroidales bacterium]|nr:isochorismate synthase [Bacteroidales bacterium]HOI31564.1 isochorismate synthase [Bacteroidales bacterium]